MALSKQQRAELLTVSIEPNKLQESYADKSPADFMRDAFYPELINLAKITAQVVRNETLKAPGKISIGKLNQAAQIYAKIGPLLDDGKGAATPGALRITNNGKY